VDRNKGRKFVDKWNKTIEKNGAESWIDPYACVEDSGAD
jgi:hypothetical protein